MKLEPFLLDQWLEKYESSTPPIQFHLGSSTGPPWTTNELLSLIPWLNSGVNSRRFCESLATLGVLVAPGDCFEMPSHFRVGFGALDQERFASALKLISGYVQLKSTQAVIGG